jgi:hypothetical protein
MTASFKLYNFSYEIAAIFHLMLHCVPLFFNVPKSHILGNAESKVTPALDSYLYVNTHAIKLQTIPATHDKANFA